MGACVKSPDEMRRNSLSTVRLTRDNKELQIQKPVFTQIGIKITKNPITHKLEGVPRQWADNYNLPIAIDYDKTIETKHFPQEIRPEQELPEAILQLIYSQPLILSAISGFDILEEKPTLPTNQNIKLEVDMKTPYGIKNLSVKWIEQMRNSQLNPQDVLSNPKAMIDIITSYNGNLAESSHIKKLFSSSQFDRIVEKVSFIQQNPAKSFKFGEEIGNGAVCKVFKGKRKQNQNQQYAVRIFKINEYKMLRKIQVQIAVMKFCASNNIIKYYFSYYYKESLFMFIQYMNAGSLTNLIKNTNQIDENIIAYIIRQILIGLDIIHKKSQIHRDIKSDNILLNQSGNVKIADFGHALQLTKQILSGEGVVGTPAWMAPQLIKKQDYTCSVDIWSLGIVILELCNGQPPYLRHHHLKAMYLIVSQPAPRLTGYSSTLKSFTQACLQKNPSDRSTTTDLLRHPFISQLGTGQVEKEKLKIILKSLNIKK